MATFELTGPDGGTYHVDAPDEHAAVAAFSAFHGAPDAPPVGIGEDAAKSLGSGLASATVNTIGGLGDLRDLASRGVDAAGAKLGFDPSRAKGIASTVAGLTPIGAAINAAPTSKDVLSTVTDPIVSPDYQPQSGLGSVLKTGAEFLPAMADPELAGPGALKTAAKLFATRVAAPTLSSESAGALTKGTAAEPYARAAGALLGAGGAAVGENKINAALAARNAAALNPDVSTLKRVARSGYQHPDVQDVRIHPQVTSDLADTISADLQHGQNSGFRPANEPKVFSAIDELKTAAAEGRPSTVADLDNVRQVLGNAAKEKDITGQPTRQAVAASRAVGHIDNFLPSLQQPQLLAGDAAKANSILDAARQNWGAAKRAEQVQTLAKNAEINAASSHSGANIQNATKQAFKPLMKNNYQKASGFNDAEKEALAGIVKGTFTGHAARFAGNLLGGGGGLGMLAGAGAGYEAGGVPGALAGAAVGKAFKAIGNRSTFNAVQRLDSLIRSRAPEAVRIAAQNPQLATVLPPTSMRMLRTMILSQTALRDMSNNQRQPVGSANAN